MDQHFENLSEYPDGETRQIVGGGGSSRQPSHPLLPGGALGAILPEDQRPKDLRSSGGTENSMGSVEERLQESLHQSSLCWMCYKNERQCRSQDCIMQFSGGGGGAS